MILVLIVSIHVDLHTKNGCDLDFFKNSVVTLQIRPSEIEYNHDIYIFCLFVSREWVHMDYVWHLSVVAIDLPFK